METSNFFTVYNFQNQDTKLKTSDFVENYPNITYFGAIYPPHINTNNLCFSLNGDRVANDYVKII
jgi:hypothetical protein